jgi:IclR family transcriptional regulator, acetate operon repressor
MTETKDLVAAREYGPLPQYPIESVDNALQVLMLLVERSEIRLTEVSSHLSVASSTAHRLLAMLVYRGLVRQDPQTKAYRSGPSLDLLAFSVVGRLDIRVRARRVLEKLNADLRETVHLGRLDRTQVDFVDSIESPQALRVSARLGVAMPAHCTSTGKALLAALTDEQLEALYPEPQLTQLTPRSIRSKRALKSELAIVRRHGFAISDEEGEEGVVSTAVPLRGGAFALAASVPVSRMDTDFREVVLETLQAAKAEIDSLLP